jgi:cytochrome c-type biogenesis protein CcmE
MITRTLRYVVLPAVVAAAVIGVVRLLGDGEPTYLSVDQVVSDPARWQGESVAVQGIVQPASRQQDEAGDWRFTVASQGERLSVRYTGVVPSTFVDEAQVLVIGELRDRELSARHLSARDPSMARGPSR